MKHRFCLECKNFEDRNEIDGVVLCARGHRPIIACPDFQNRFEGLRKIASKTRFCFECENFEDRSEVDGSVICARGHKPGVNCPEFQDRRVDIFYSYIYWAYLYSTGKIGEGKDYFEKRFLRKLSNEEFAYACLLDYFELGLEDFYFYECWKAVRKIYQEKFPTVSKIFDMALQRFESHNEKTDLEKVFSDLLFFKKPLENYQRDLKVIMEELKNGK